MRPQKLWPAIAACVVGCVVLAIWFDRFSPTRDWPLEQKSVLIEKGRQVAKHFGVDVNGWKAHATPSVEKAIAFYFHSWPAEAQKLSVSPLTLRITYVGPNDHPVEVGFDSEGTLIYWQAPKGWTGGPKFESDAAASAEAFALFAQGNAANYKNPIRTMGDKAHEEDYEWTLKPPRKFEYREWIKVKVNKSVVQSVERHRYLLGDDEDTRVGDGRQYWSALDGIFGVSIAAAVVAAIALYVLWSARKVINHVFPLRMVGACYAFYLVKTFFGTDWSRMLSTNGDNKSDSGPGIVIQLLLLAVIVTVGRGLSERGRMKWIGLEQLLGLAPVAKQTGRGIAAGLLFSPMLTAIPFLIAGIGVIPETWVLPRNAQVLYGKAAALDVLSISESVSLLLFFGFGLPALERMIGFRWLRWFFVAPAGAVFFAQTRVISGPLAAPILAGFLTLALFWFVWSRFDLLALLTLQASAGFVVAALMLFQKGEGAVGCLGGLAIVGAFAGVICWRGSEADLGDPRATIPALTGFRAEREKLKAEFSVARRAQQDMLPRSPPTIDGYSLAASCTPSLDVGGDLYDFWLLPDGRVGIGVADVSGKGVPAALYMTLTKGLLAAVTRNSSDLCKVLSEVNRHLHSVTRKKVFVTMVLAFLDVQRRRLQCARAGHNPAVWRQASRDVTTLVSPTGLGLGITAGKIFETQLKLQELDLSEGDAVVFYSDGITEAMNRELEQFGEERLMAAVEKTDNMDATAARESILNEVTDFLDGVHPQDDMTLVVLRVGATNS